MSQLLLTVPPSEGAAGAALGLAAAAGDAVTVAVTLSPGAGEAPTAPAGDISGERAGDIPGATGSGGTEATGFGAAAAGAFGGAAGAGLV